MTVGSDQYYVKININWEFGVDKGPDASDARFEKISGGPAGGEWLSLQYNHAVVLQDKALMTPINAMNKALSDLGYSALEVLGLDGVKNK